MNETSTPYTSVLVWSRLVILAQTGYPVRQLVPETPGGEGPRITSSTASAGGIE